MIHFLSRRLLLTIPVLFGVATLVFSLIHLVPGDPVQSMLGESASPSDMANLRARLGLDRPLYVQYGSFLAGLAKGDLGVSLRTNQPVAAAIAERLPATFELASAAMVVAVLVAIPLGILAAVRAGTRIRPLGDDAGPSAFRCRTSGSGRSSPLSLPSPSDGCRWPGGAPSRISCCQPSRSERRSRRC
jgi:ABC-type dipeptide/oligopeptide/nickel transport system permease component